MIKRAYPHTPDMSNVPPGEKGPYIYKSKQFMPYSNLNWETEFDKRVGKMSEDAKYTYRCGCKSLFSNPVWEAEFNQRLKIMYDEICKVIDERQKNGN